jgi:hypothetical protein
MRRCVEKPCFVEERLSRDLAGRLVDGQTMAVCGTAGANAEEMIDVVER